jgi:hypothetical protein
MLECYSVGENRVEEVPWFEVEVRLVRKRRVFTGMGGGVRIMRSSHTRSDANMR